MGNSLPISTEKDLLALEQGMLDTRNNLSCEWNKGDPETNPYNLPKEDYIDEYMPNFKYTLPNVWAAENRELEIRMIKHSIRVQRYKTAQRTDMESPAQSSEVLDNITDSMVELGF